MEGKDEKPKVSIDVGVATPAQIAEIERGSFVTPKQIANKFRFTRSYITQLLKDGRIKGVKPLGGQWRIPESEFERLQKEGCPGLRREKPEETPEEILVNQKHVERVKGKPKPPDGKKINVSLYDMFFGEGGKD